MDETQPWISCYVTDILLSYLRETLDSEEQIDYGALFRGIEGFEPPADPRSYLADVRNWIPLAILRELESQCERISGRKDVAYLAARAYFTPGRKQLPSLFEVILQILHDVRSTMLFANAWGASQTNYLKLQSFEKSPSDPDLYILAQFAANAGPAIGAINLLKGFVEGVPHIYPGREEVACVEEISQLRLDAIVREFPLYSAVRRGDSVTIQSRDGAAAVTAKRVALQTERIRLPGDFVESTPDTVVVAPREGAIEVLTAEVAADPTADGPALRHGYRITAPGVIAHGKLTYEFKAGQIYDAPYCRFRIAIKEQRTAPRQEISVERLRQEVSKLLFEQLRQTKQTHTRIVQMSVEKHQLAAENVRLRREFQREYSFAGLIGRSKQMQELFGLIRSIAETDVTVLVHGETGTGKELIARAIHYNGPRKNRRFVAINCGALSLTLLESELFGHEKGAFTGAVGLKKGIFEIADGGTLFLDEIGEISPSTQVKLLRVLQEGEVQRVGGTDTIKVDVRIIAATNQNLGQLVEKNGFRQDLFYRLNVFPLAVPPLRERIDDIPLLTSHFIEKSQQLTKKSVTDISAPALALLMAYGWPGNIRELENTIQRMMVVCKGDRLDVPDMPFEIRGADAAPAANAQLLKGISRESTELVEKRTIAEALKKTGGNVTHTAKALGISRATLQNKMKQYGLRQSDS